MLKIFIEECVDSDYTLRKRNHQQVLSIGVLDITYFKRITLATKYKETVGINEQTETLNIKELIMQKYINFGKGGSVS